jgi:sulfide:quinone oxidoreductase
MNLNNRDITGYTGYFFDRVEPGRIFYKNGKILPYNLLISFPPYVAVYHFLNLLSNDRGFIQAAPNTTRQVVNHPNIYAARGTADFPVKQAFLAFLRSDTAAEQITAQIMSRESKLQFDPVSMCIMEQFDNATFVQVPLRMTGWPDLLVEV